jgi:GTP pyrophosphokinase
MEQKLQMFRNIIDATSDELSDDQEFVSNVSVELLSKSIYVNTPAGDVVELPEGSSPIDFAYRIHSKVGDTCVGAIVNDKIVPLEYTLQDGDVIKIMTDPNSVPKKDWLNIAKTTQAKSKIKSYFSKQDKEIYLERGKELLEKELKHRHIPLSEGLSQEHIDKLINDLHMSCIEDIYLSIGSMRYTPLYIVDLLYEDKKNIEDTFLDKIKHQSYKHDKNYKNDILVSGNDDILVNLASCCKPIYGDEIVGYITKGDGITVHKKDCVNIRDVNTRLIDVSWSSARTANDGDKKYVAKLKIDLAKNEKHDLVDIVAKATTRDIIITSINEVDKGTYSYYDVLIKVKNKEDLDLFIDMLKTLKFIDDVRRV